MTSCNGSAYLKTNYFKKVKIERSWTMVHKN